jgi:hypothetical protein
MIPKAILFSNLNISKRMTVAPLLHSVAFAITQVVNRRRLESGSMIWSLLEGLSYTIPTVAQHEQTITLSFYFRLRLESYI